MLTIKKKYAINENNKPVAVQINLPTFEKFESFLEDYVLGKKMEEVESEPSLDKSTAQAYYAKLKKKS